MLLKLMTLMTIYTYASKPLINTINVTVDGNIECYHFIPNNITFRNSKRPRGRPKGTKYSYKTFLAKKNYKNENSKTSTVTTNPAPVSSNRISYTDITD